MNIKSLKLGQSVIVKAELDNEEWGNVLNYLRYLYNIYQNLHWLSKGSDFYGDHLLYERLYKKLLEEVDQVAERLIGLNFELPDLKSLGFIMTSYATLELAVSVEQELNNKLNQLEVKVDSLGVKDLFGQLASSRQESLYLLGQRNKVGANVDLKKERELHNKEIDKKIKKLQMNINDSEDSSEKKFFRDEIKKLKEDKFINMEEMKKGAKQP